MKKDVELLCDPETVPCWPRSHAYRSVAAWRYGINLSCWRRIDYAATVSAPRRTWTTSGTLLDVRPPEEEHADVVA